MHMDGVQRRGLLTMARGKHLAMKSGVGRRSCDHPTFLRLRRLAKIRPFLSRCSPHCSRWFEISPCPLSKRGGSLSEGISAIVGVSDVIDGNLFIPQSRLRVFGAYDVIDGVPFTHAGSHRPLSDVMTTSRQYTLCSP